MYNSYSFPDDRFERELAAYEREQEAAEKWANTVHSSDSELLKLGANYLVDYYLQEEDFCYTEDIELTERMLDEKQLWSAFEKSFSDFDKNFYKNWNDDWAGGSSAFIVAVEIFINELKEIGLPLNLKSIFDHGDNLEARLLERYTCDECGLEDWNKTQEKFLVEILAEAESNCYTIEGIDYGIQMIKEGKELPKPLFWWSSPQCSVHNPEREQKEQELRSRSGASKEGDKNA